MVELIEINEFNNIWFLMEFCKKKTFLVCNASVMIVFKMSHTWNCNCWQFYPGNQ